MSKRKFIFEDDDDDDSSESDVDTADPSPLSANSEEEDQYDTQTCKEIDLTTHAVRDYDDTEDNMTEKERREMEAFIDSDDEHDGESAFGSEHYHKDRCDSEAEEGIEVQEFLQALEANKKREQEREERLRNGIQPFNHLTLFDMFTRKPARVKFATTEQPTMVPQNMDTTMFSKRRHTSKPVKAFRYTATKKTRLICTKRGCGNYRETSQWLCVSCNEEQCQASNKKKKKKKKRNKVNR